jgi:hypothetical protein
MERAEEPRRVLVDEGLTVTGELANELDEPSADLCQSCADRFRDWLKNADNGVGATSARRAAELVPAGDDTGPIRGVKYCRGGKSVRAERSSFCKLGCPRTWGKGPVNTRARRAGGYIPADTSRRNNNATRDVAGGVVCVGSVEGNRGADS